MKAVVEKMTQSDAAYYLMTGDTFNGQKAAAMRLVNEAVPLAQLREHTERSSAEAYGKKLAHSFDDEADLPTRQRNELGCCGRLSSTQKHRKPIRPTLNRAANKECSNSWTRNLSSQDWDNTGVRTNRLSVVVCGGNLNSHLMEEKN